MFCEEIVKSSGLKCTNKQKLTRDDGKKVCGRHKTTKVVLEKFNKEETKEETIIEEKKENQNKLKIGPLKHFSEPMVNEEPDDIDLSLQICYLNH